MRRFHQMPGRYLVGAPEIVRAQVLDIIQVRDPAPLDYEIIFRPSKEDEEVTGLDFGKYGGQGSHFFLSEDEARAYRLRNRFRRIAWTDLPEPTRQRIISYLERT